MPPARAGFALTKWVSFDKEKRKMEYPKIIIFAGAEVNKKNPNKKNPNKTEILNEEKETGSLGESVGSECKNTLFVLDIGNLSCFF